MAGWMDEFGHSRGDGGIGVFVFALFKFPHELYLYVFCSLVYAEDLSKKYE